MLPGDEYIVVANLSRRVWPDTSLHLLSNGVGKAAEPLQWFVVRVQLRKNCCWFQKWLSVSHTISPDTKSEVPGQCSHCLILRHFCCPMMLHQLERRSELENTFLLAWRFEEVHLSINSGDSKKEVYGCLLRSKDLPHLRKTLTWRDIRLLNLGGRKRVQHSDRSANGEGT